VPLAKPHSFSPVDDQPLELNPTSKDDKDNADMPTIAVEEGNLDTTNSKPSSEYFDEYEFNHQHPDSIYNKSNVTEKMSKDISDKVTASSMSSTRSEQVYSQSSSMAKVSYDIFTGDKIIVKGFLSMGKNNLDNSGTMKPAFLIRTLVKADKTLAKEGPAMRKFAAREIALLRNPKTMAQALRTPQRIEWIDAINKEMTSLLDKEVYEIRKVPVGRRLIPTKLVLRIKLANDGSVDKYKARCVVAGYRQTAGLDYDPDGVYSPMAEPTTVRLVLAISSALKLNIDHLDIRTTFLNGEILENEQFFCSPPPGFRVPEGMGWLIKKGLYDAHQSRFI